jgi:hypothetical protein
VHKALFGLSEQLIQSAGTRRTWLEAMRATYLDEPLSPTMRGLFDTMHYGYSDEKRVRWPALRSGVDAVHSKIAKTHPRPQFLTTDGDWQLQVRAELATQWTDGEFSRAHLDDMLERVFLDAEIYGTGAIWVGEQHDQPCYERVHVGDLYVDPREEIHDAVRSMYRIRRMDVGVLCEMFPDKRKEIEAARRVDPHPDDRLGQDMGIADIVQAVEAWRLPDGPEKKGRHTIVVDGATLLDDREWDSDCFPFAFVHWSRDPRRFFGIGLVEQMLAPQAELNEMAETYSQARHLFVPILIAEEGSIQADEMTNEVGRYYAIKPGSTIAPTVQHSTPMFLQMAQAEEIYIERVWKMAGVSAMSVASQKEPGLNSGKAIQNFADLESERFAMANRSWERLAVDVARLGYKCAQRIAKGDATKARKLEVLGGKEALESVAFSDADMGDSPYRIDVFPVSQLSNSIAAKIDEVMSMVNAQLIDDPDDAREMLALPDLKRYNSIRSAGRKLVRKIIDKALKTGIATAPDPYMPLPYLIHYGSLSCNLAAQAGAPDSHIQCLRDMVQSAIDLKTDIAAGLHPHAPGAPPPAPAGGPPMPPAGPPMPPDPMMGPPIGGPPLAVVPPVM